MLTKNFCNRSTNFVQIVLPNAFQCIDHVSLIGNPILIEFNERRNNDDGLMLCFVSIFMRCQYNQLTLNSLHAIARIAQNQLNQSICFRLHDISEFYAFTVLQQVNDKTIILLILDVVVVHQQIDGVAGKAKQKFHQWLTERTRRLDHQTLLRLQYEATQCLDKFIGGGRNLMENAQNCGNFELGVACLGNRQEILAFVGCYREFEHFANVLQQLFAQFLVEHGREQLREI